MSLSDKSLGRCLATSLGLLVSSVAPSTQAQILGGLSGADLGPQDPFSVVQFSPAPGPRNFITTRSARTDGELAYSLGIVASYASKPFVVQSCEQLGDEQQCVDVNVVENLVVGDLLVGFTPVPRLQFGLRVPVTFVEGDGLVDGAADIEGGGIDAFGLADLELEAKVRAVGEVDSLFNLGLAGFVTAPTGEATAAGSFIGDETPSAGVRAIFDVSHEFFGFGINLGYVFRGDLDVGGTTIGNAYLYSAAATARISPVVALVADAYGSTRFSSDTGSSGVELDGALQVSPLQSGFTLSVGGGAATARGVGYPASRVLIGLNYTAEYVDSDDDGIQDRVDACPTEPEDYDGYEDSDGCPEKDNDGDAIMDENDRCPDQAEDVDQYEDLDGCPEFDNDSDGIPDVQDRCPLEVETMNDWEDDDGCPDTPDRDHDGVKDDVDKCPLEAEDTDGFQDTDGCPEPDNDQDGILDESDECIDTPEDFNGVDDEDGCPDADVSPAATP